MKYRLLEIIVCPICHSHLLFNAEYRVLICKLDNVAFPIDRGIPVLLKRKAKNFYTK